MAPVSNDKLTLPASQVVRINPLTLFAVLVIFLCVLFPALGWPVLFGWLILVPLLLAFWIVRVRTTVSEEGLRARSLRGTRFVSWDEIKGLRFPKRGSARAVLAGGGEAVLPAVTLEDTPLLAQFSGGRLPDPYAAARAKTSPARTNDTDNADDQASAEH